MRDNILLMSLNMGNSPKTSSGKGIWLNLWIIKNMESIKRTLYNRKTGFRFVLFRIPEKEKCEEGYQW